MGLLECQKCGHALAQTVALKWTTAHALEEDSQEPNLAQDSSGSYVECGECHARNVVVCTMNANGIPVWGLAGLR
jgi:hypothetical protein